MSKFSVSWGVEVEADSFVAAAIEASRQQRDPSFKNNNFIVLKMEDLGDGAVQEVDLDALFGHSPT